MSLILLCLTAVGPDLVDFAMEGSAHPMGAGLWTHSLPAMACYAVAVFATYLFSRMTAKPPCCWELSLRLTSWRI